MINTRQHVDYWDPARKGFITNYPNFMQWKRLDPTQLGDSGPLNLYIHTPYCIQRCSYCYYKTINLRGAEKSARMERYVDALCQELELASKVFHLSERRTHSVYFGGGTPTLLSDSLLRKIDDTIRKNYRIEGAEYSVEAEPVTLTKEKLDTLLQLGVTRISMGIQSFDSTIIRQSHRLDDEKKALRALELALSSGKIINIDLMSGLAGETDQTWAHSVRTAIASGAQSITVYKTELYANTEYYKGIKEKTIELPSDDDELRYMNHALDALEQAEYVPWSFYTFTKNNEHVHIHSPSVFRGDDIYAFGVSAFGRLGPYVFQNTNDEEKYQELLQSGQLTVQRGHYLHALDNMIRDVVLGMKLTTFDLAAFQKKYGIALKTLAGDALSQLQAGEFIAIEGNRIRTLRRGILYGDYVGKSVARALMAYAGDDDEV